MLKITYLRINNQGTSIDPRDSYAQSIEPAGEYISFNDHKHIISLPNWEYGIITFNNPLIIDFISTGHGGWKTNLSKMFGNKKKKALSNAIKKSGYDAIITVNEKGEYEEIVNLSGIKG